jgi:hypothetical protein
MHRYERVNPLNSLEVQVGHTNMIQLYVLQSLSKLVPYAFCTLVQAAAGSDVWVCVRWLADIVGLNPAGGMNACLLQVLLVVSATGRSVRGFVPTVVCIECDLENSRMWRPRPCCGCRAVNCSVSLLGVVFTNGR